MLGQAKIDRNLRHVEPAEPGWAGLSGFPSPAWSPPHSARVSGHLGLAALEVIPPANAAEPRLARRRCVCASPSAATPGQPAARQRLPSADDNANADHDAERFGGMSVADVCRAAW